VRAAGLCAKTNQQNTVRELASRKDQPLVPGNETNTFADSQRRKQSIAQSQRQRRTHPFARLQSAHIVIHMITRAITHVYPQSKHEQTHTRKNIPTYAHI
jgi:Na+-transporting NADH:ubiquinone oxidoreductase subunit NqrC